MPYRLQVYQKSAWCWLERKSRSIPLFTCLWGPCQDIHLLLIHTDVRCDDMLNVGFHVNPEPFTSIPALCTNTMQGRKSACCGANWTDFIFHAKDPVIKRGAPRESRTCARRHQLCCSDTRKHCPLERASGEKRNYLHWERTGPHSAAGGSLIVCVATQTHKK